MKQVVAIDTFKVVNFVFSYQVAIPMRFNGSSGVEVRPPSNLEDLKAYTSLSFFLQRPQKRSDMPQRASDRFVLYLGNKDVSIF